MELPPIKKLFEDSWQTFSKSILSLFLLNILGLVIYLGLAIVAVLIFIITGAGSMLLQNGFQNISSNIPSLITSPGFTGLIISFAVVAVIFGVLCMIISIALQAASIVIVDSQGQAALGISFKKGLRVVAPLILVNVLTFLLSFGALFVFILPALLFYFLLAFVQFEVILNNQRWTSAIKRSVAIVSRHFGGILIRLVLLFLIYVAYTILTNLLSKLGPDTAILIGIVSFIINLLLGWFSLSYVITLYKEAKVGLDQEKGKSILWMWVIAIIGWLIAIALGFATYKTITSGVLNNFLPKSATPAAITEQANSPASKYIIAGTVKIQAAGELTKQIQNSKIPLTQKQKTELTGLLNEALANFNNAVSVDPNNFEAWYYRGITYQSLSGSIPNANQLATESFTKALELAPQNSPERTLIEAQLKTLKPS